MRAILQLIDRPGRITTGEIHFRRRTTASRRPRAAAAARRGDARHPRRRDRADPAGADGGLQPGAHGRRPDHRGDPAAQPSLAAPAASSAAREARDITVGLFRDVGISMPEQRIDAYSWQLSGGLRQRAMIAMALLQAAPADRRRADDGDRRHHPGPGAGAAARPAGASYNTAIIFITHDLGVIAQMASYVVVMYLGRVMEEGPVDDIFHAPKHPYTRALLRSIPSLVRPDARRPAGDQRRPAASLQPAARLPVPSALPRRRWPRCSAAVPSLHAGRHQPARELLPASRRGGPAMTRRQPPTTAQPLLEVRGLQKFFPITQGLPAAHRRPCPRRRRRRLHRQRGRDAGPGGRERLRQDHGVALHPARHRADRRPDPLSHARRQGRRPRAACRQPSCGRCAPRSR